MDRAIRSLQDAAERLEESAAMCRRRIEETEADLAHDRAALAEAEERRAEYLAAIEALKG